MPERAGRAGGPGRHRIWAIVVLGRSFRTTVEVDQGQPVVTGGPYRDYQSRTERLLPGVR
jgi:protein-S-isoprenylcysteine O-methyltransferase Ste14